MPLLVNSSYSLAVVLTAAHCVRAEFPSAVRIGSLTREDGTVVSVDRSSSIRHPAWTGNITGGGDLAILKLSQPVSNTVAEVNGSPFIP